MFVIMLQGFVDMSDDFFFFMNFYFRVEIIYKCFYYVFFNMVKFLFVVFVIIVLVVGKLKVFFVVEFWLQFFVEVNGEVIGVLGIFYYLVQFFIIDCVFFGYVVQ